MGKLKLRGPSRRDLKRSHHEAFGIHPQGTWMFVLSLGDGEIGLAHAAAVREEADRRGAPFVVLDEGQESAADQIGIVFVTAKNEAAFRAVQDIYQVPPQYRDVAPLTAIRSLKTGRGAISFGSIADQPDVIKRVFDDAIAMGKDPN